MRDTTSTISTGRRYLCIVITTTVTRTFLDHATHVTKYRNCNNCLQGVKQYKKRDLFVAYGLHEVFKEQLYKELQAYTSVRLKNK